MQRRHVQKEVLVLSLLCCCRWTKMYDYYLNAMDAIYKVGSLSKTPPPESGLVPIYLPLTTGLHASALNRLDSTAVQSLCARSSTLE